MGRDVAIVFPVLQASQSSSTHGSAWVLINAKTTTSVSTVQA